MKHSFKALLASLLVTAALVTPAVVLSSTRTYAGEVYFEGVDLRVLPGGSVQAIFGVSVDTLQNCTGAEFYLSYNEEYLIPSDFTTNRPSGKLGIDYDDYFFQVDEDLYGKRDSGGALVSPFSERLLSIATGEMEYYSYADVGSHVVHMRIQLNQEPTSVLRTEGVGGKIKELRDFGGDLDTQVGYVINHEDDTADKVTLGYLSFEVNKEYLPEIVRLFDDLGPTNSPAVSTPGGKVSLLNVDTSKQDYLSLFAYTGQKYDRDANRRFDATVTNGLFEFHIDEKTPITAELANPAVVINAYQAYTNNNNKEDLALALRRYSPMATVTYADGSKENFIVPWGMNDALFGDYGYTAEYYTGGAVTDSNYDPTGGRYLIGQRVPIRGVLFPDPVVADLTVEPIHLLDVAASDLERTYTANMAEQEVVSGIALGLPTEARLITDVMPGGVSLVMDIPGWRPTKDGSVWPVLAADESNANTLMNTLLAEEYDPGTGRHYWPDGADRANGSIATDPAKFEGLYIFGMADGYGGPAKAGFTRGEIQGKFPWLTVDKALYAIDAAHRHIVPEEEFTDADLYVAEYVEKTFTDDNGQPTAAIRVRRADGTVMAEGSVFRVWIPNGQELGTGLVSKNIDIPGADKTLTIPDWFGLQDLDTDGKWDLDANDRPITTTGGWYQSVGNRDNTDQLLSFHLVMNPGDPAAPELAYQNRETLRRYINLGGWFLVSVCEDVDTRAWSDQIPVYVKPRENEYQESKTYNFLGGNAALMKIADPLGITITMPRGSYTPVADDGLPLYDDGVTAGGTINGGFDIMGRASLPRYSESYGFKTTYDGQTGAQPGELFQFTVDAGGNLWPGAPGGFTDVSVGGRPILQHGATDYQDKALYQGFGYVYQPDTGSYDGTVRTEGVTPEPEVPGALYEEITLTSLEPFGMTREITGDYGSNVLLATYQPKTVGYRSRQQYLLTITNTGTMDINGLSIDGLTDGYPQDVPGGRFEMLQAPASFLAVGESTTFILTYVYDLAANAPVTPEHPDNIPEYRDTLYITSDRHPVAGRHGGVTGDFLRSFDAQIVVSDTDLHRVDVIVYPVTVDDGDLTDGVYDQPVTYPMGTADIIIGEQVGVITLPDASTVNNYTMDYTPATRNYPEGQKVYVVVRPKDEYELASITARDTSGADLVITRYGVQSDGKPWTKTELLPDGRLVYLDALDQPVAEVAVLSDGTEVYSFVMTDYDTTVTVRFQEGILSKLRLSDLIDFSAGPNMDPSGERIPMGERGDGNYGLGTAGTADALLKPTTDPVHKDNTYTVWRKQYTQAEMDAAAVWASDPTMGYDPDVYLMTKGRAMPATGDPATTGNRFLPSENQYLVVIPYDADRSQIEAVLRQVEVAVDGVIPDEAKVLAGTEKEATTAEGTRRVNEDLTVDVTMARYAYDFMDFNGNVNSEVNPARKAIYGPKPGNTATPTTHTSVVFDSPEPGTSCYVRIRIGATDPGTTTTIYRYYYVEIHRKAKEPEVELHYGNSPYGMIMNGPKFISYVPDVTGAPTTEVDETVTAENREAAKNAFRQGYTFRGLANAYVPQAALDNELSATYWREAWVKNGKYYEPESGLGRDWVYLYDDGGTYAGNVWRDIPTIYDEAENLDLNDYAYFAILGEDIMEPGVIRALDSTGREVDLDQITVTARLTLLDDSKTPQADRFSGTETAVLDLGVAGRLLETIAGQGVASGDLTGDVWPVSSAKATVDGKETTVYTEIEHIRPGRYTLVYSYLDFDGYSTLEVERPFVVLTPVGDVNADLERNSTRADGGAAKTATDEYILEDRMTDPLGYTVQGTRKVPVYESDGVTQKVDATSGALVFEDAFIYEWANIFKLRVCDVNNDRNINNIDGNLIDQNARAGSGWIRFYHPTKYGIPIPGGS